MAMNKFILDMREKIRHEQIGTVPTFFCSREQIRQVENGL